MSNDKVKEETPAIDKDREAAYERARLANGGVPPAPPKDKTPEPEKKEPIPPVKEEAVPPKEKDDGRKPEEKTVPHEALHAERERRKAEQQKNRELEEALKAEKARNDSLLEDMNLLLEKKDVPLEGVDEVTKRLMEKLDAQEKELKALKAASEKWESYTKTQEQVSAKTKMEKDLSDTEERLAKAGFPGFKRFVPLVAQELGRLTREDPDTAPPDSPEGWEKVYREIVYPTVKEMFSSKTAEKEKRKEEADLPTGSDASHGQPPPDKREKTPEEIRREYLEMRRKSSFA